MVRTTVSHGTPARVLPYLETQSPPQPLSHRWLAGECRFGDRCNFAHGEQELRQGPPCGNAGPGMGGGPPGGGRGYGGGGGRGGYGGRCGGGRGFDHGGGYGFGGGRGGYGWQIGGGYNGFGGQMGGYGMQGCYGMQCGFGGPVPGGQMAGFGMPGAPAGSAPRAATNGMSGPGGWLMYVDPETGDAYFHHP